MYEEGISLGWNCDSAINGVSMGLRKTKQNGYKTCPFDEMITNYKGIIDCIKDNFEYLCDKNYLELIKISKESKWLNTNGDGDTLIYNKKYKFIFNHESPGHANLFVNQQWTKGINHYIMNDYEEFINRYKRRITNIKELLNSGKNITFILTRPNTELKHIYELQTVLINRYPLLNFKFVLLDFDKYIYYDHLLLMKIDENDDEIKRLVC
uniref:Papain-like cysteine peptidase n=1 Tax=viral metagenome TaxID=1070528 RepID=A0A6C0D980_9ZZZZ